VKGAFGKLHHSYLPAWKQIPHNLVGVVEEVGLRKEVVTSLDELWSILNPIKSTPEKGKGEAMHGKKRAASEGGME